MPPKSKSVTTRSKASKQQREVISAASGSSPPKGTRPKKKTTFESLEATETTPQVVTETKQARASNSSNSDSTGTETENSLNSTRNENALVTMALNLTPGVDSRLDKKLDHILQEFLLAVGKDHEIRKMFQAENLFQFMNFIDYTVEDLEEMRMQSHTSTTGFNKRKVTQIYNVIRYYGFLGDSDPGLADDPEKWSMKDFRKWMREGRHPTVASFNASKATSTTTAPLLLRQRPQFVRIQRRQRMLG